MKEYQGQLQGQGFRFGIVIARFNELITKNLLAGALDGLRRHGVSDENITTAWVPGSVEIPLAVQTLIKTKKFDAIICLGAVIRGATPHFDYVCSQVSSGVATLSLEHSIPVIFGVITTNTIEEAIERAGTKVGNKGFEGAVAAIEMVSLMKQLS